MKIVLEEKIDFTGKRIPTHYFEYKGNGIWKEWRCFNDCFQSYEIGPKTIFYYLEKRPDLKEMLSEEEKEILEKYQKDPVFRLKIELYFSIGGIEELRDFLDKIRNLHIMSPFECMLRILEELELGKDFVIEEIFLQFGEDIYKAEEKIKNLRREIEKKHVIGIIYSERWDIIGILIV